MTTNLGQQAYGTALMVGGGGIAELGLLRGAAVLVCGVFVAVALDLWAGAA
jgi:hypothetical protein